MFTCPLTDVLVRTMLGSPGGSSCGSVASMTPTSRPSDDQGQSKTTRYRKLPVEMTNAALSQSSMQTSQVGPEVRDPKDRSTTNRGSHGIAKKASSIDSSRHLSRAPRAVPMQPSFKRTLICIYIRLLHPNICSVCTYHLRSSFQNNSPLVPAYLVFVPASNFRLQFSHINLITSLLQHGCTRDISRRSGADIPLWIHRRHDNEGLLIHI